MIQKLIRNSLILAISLFVIEGCVSRKNSGGGGGSSYIYTYHKGKDSTIHFASNIKFKGKNKESLVMDITYTEISNQENNIVCNFSVFTTNPKFKPNNFKIKLDQQPTGEINQFEKIYAEALKKDRYEYRYSILIPDKDFTVLMNEKSPIIKLNGSEFRPKRKFKKQAEQIRMKVLFDNAN